MDVGVVTEEFTDVWVAFSPAQSKEYLINSYQCLVKESKQEESQENFSKEAFVSSSCFHRIQANTYLCSPCLGDLGWIHARYLSVQVQYLSCTDSLESSYSVTFILVCSQRGDRIPRCTGKEL